jgi:hypothetical protein
MTRFTYSIEGGPEVTLATIIDENAEAEPLSGAEITELVTMAVGATTCVGMVEVRRLS